MGNSKSKKSTKSTTAPQPKPTSTTAPNKPKPKDDEKKSDSSNLQLRKQSSAQLEGLEIIKKGFVKIDHFENIYRIEPKVNGAPNFRQTQGFYIFGGGQPTIDAHELLLTTFKGSVSLSLFIFLILYFYFCFFCF